MVRAVVARSIALGEAEGRECVCYATVVRWRLTELVEVTKKKYQQQLKRKKKRKKRRSDGR